MRFAISICIALSIELFGIALAPAGSTSKWMLETEVRGVKIEGVPISWSESSVCLLSRDGRMWNFNPKEAKNSQQTTRYFQGYSAGEMRGRLERELGSGFEVVTTRHFVVAFPRGQQVNWAERFEDLYNSFFHYFAVRGLEPKAAEFPLVAIVWKTKQDFLHYASREGMTPSQDLLGYYLPASNRITLYDTSGGKSGKDWQLNAETIIHEATHQTAFNTGIHTRYAPQPRWLAEGLATMFEAPGVYNSRSYSRQSDRINRGRLEQFKQYVKRRKPGAFQELISSDRIFERDTTAAYCEAWALTFYLVETRPREYGKLLSRMASRPPFEAYSGAQRLADFTAVFGENLPLLEAQFLQYMADLK